MTDHTNVADELSAGATARFEFHSEALDIPVHLEAITLEEHLTQTYEAVVQLRTTAAPPPYSQLLGKDCVARIHWALRGMRRGPLCRRDQRYRPCTGWLDRTHR